MNSRTLLFVIVALAASACTHDVDHAASTSPVGDLQSPTYDSLLAGRLGADEYGMSQYVMAFLRSGPNRDQDSTEAMELQRAHLNNINRLAAEGKLVLAGPFLDDGEIRGIYVFDVSSIEEARALTATDPAIQAGRLEMELHPWYGSAALKQLNETHNRISKNEP